MATKFKRAIVWFRRDLRISDHPALHQASRDADEIVPIYVISKWSGSHRWTGVPRQKFLCGCLASLDANLQARGGRLVFRQGSADSEIESLLRECRADAIYFNRDVDPFGIAMQDAVSRRCRELGAEVFSFKDAVLHAKDEVLTTAGEPYRVYTPYSRSWLQEPKPEPVGRPRTIAVPTTIKSLPCPDLATWKLGDADADADADLDILEAGENAARQRLRKALEGPIRRYARDRDRPSGSTTSRLSQDLRFGLLSIREIHARCAELARSCGDATIRDSVHVFVKELAWREFYMQVLGHFPDVLEHEFNPNYRHLPWANDSGAFERWSQGQTGFPIVDAGMRQLLKTGFMHNRIRMIVSMFLTKDLHLDWRLGESWFMQRLVDGEIASNNGGWQWSAGTGADAAPYFRIQNPWTQTARHDPDGEFIHRWVPELRDVEPKRFHSPPESGESLVPGYPAPMVDHAEERERTLALFKEHRAKA